MVKTDTPLKAIRAKCIDCSCGSKPEVRECPRTICELYPYRMGHNPKRAGMGPKDTRHLQVAKNARGLAHSRQNDKENAMAQLIRDITTVEHNYYIRFEPDSPYTGGDIHLGKYQDGEWKECAQVYSSKRPGKFGEEVYPGQHGTIRFGYLATALEKQLARLNMQFVMDMDASDKIVKSSRLLEIYWTLRTAELINEYLRPSGGEVIVAELADIPDDIAGEGDPDDVEGGSMDADQSMAHSHVITGDGLSGGFRDAVCGDLDTMMKPPEYSPMKKEVNRVARKK